MCEIYNQDSPDDLALSLSLLSSIFFFVSRFSSIRTQRGGLRHREASRYADNLGTPSPFSACIQQYPSERGITRGNWRRRRRIRRTYVIDDELAVGTAASGPLRERLAAGKLTDDGGERPTPAVEVSRVGDGITQVHHSLYEATPAEGEKS